MALSTSEAHDVNTLLDYLLRRTPPGSGSPPDAETAKAAAARLAGKAHHQLMAGVTANDVEQGWPGGTP